MKKLSLTLLIFLLTTYSYSNKEWHLIGFGSETIKAVAVHPENPNIIFASGYDLYKSVDGGVTWDTVSIHSPDVIRFHPLNPDTIFFVFGGGSFSSGIYYSTDCGDNWNSLYYFPYITDISVSLHNPLEMYFSTSNAGIFNSTNGGSTWDAMNDSLGNLNILSLEVVHPADTSTTISAGANYGLYYYSTYWVKTNAINLTTHRIRAYNPDSSELWAVIGSGTESDGIYKSSDFGSSWDLSEFWESLSDVTVNPLNKDNVYASSLTLGVKATFNEGSDWYYMNNNIGDPSVYSLAQSKADTTRLYAGTSHGLYVYEITTGINNKYTVAYSINIYPNPCSNMLNIIFSNADKKDVSLEIFDIKGQEMFNKQYNNIQSCISVNINKFPKGIYFVKISNGSIYRAEKIIVN